MKMKRTQVVVIGGLGLLVIVLAGALAGGAPPAKRPAAATAPAGLAGRLPAGYGAAAEISVLEWELTNAAPMIQTTTTAAGVLYLGYKLEAADAGRIVLAFMAKRAVWDRDGLVKGTALATGTRFSDIPTALWAIEVVDLASHRVHRHDGGKWSARPLGGDK